MMKGDSMNIQKGDHPQVAFLLFKFFVSRIDSPICDEVFR